MQIHTQDHEEIIAAFEKTFPLFTGYCPRRFDKEGKELWPKGRIYQNGEVNALFGVYRHGVSYGRATA